MPVRSVVIVWIVALLLGLGVWWTMPRADREGPHEPGGSGGSADVPRSVRMGLDPAAVDRVTVTASGRVVEAERSGWIGDRWTLSRLDDAGRVVWRWPVESGRMLAFLRTLATAELLPSGAEPGAPGSTVVEVRESDRVTRLGFNIGVIGGRMDGLLSRPAAEPLGVVLTADTAERVTLETLRGLRIAEPLFRIGSGPRKITVERRTDAGEARSTLERRNGRWFFSENDGPDLGIATERAGVVVDLVTGITSKTVVDADPDLEQRSPGVTITAETPTGLEGNAVRLVTQTFRLYALDGQATASLVESIGGQPVSDGRMAFMASDQSVARAIAAFEALAAPPKSGSSDRGD